MTPADTAKTIVRDWFKWADQGGYIGHLDRPAMERLEMAITRAITEAQMPFAEKVAELTAKAKRKPKGEAA